MSTRQTRKQLHSDLKALLAQASEMLENKQHEDPAADYPMRCGAAAAYIRTAVKLLEQAEGKR